jgi:hypothetical protein
MPVSLISAIRFTFLALLLVTQPGVVPPHLHEASVPGFYNQEHDFALLAATGLTALSPALLASLPSPECALVPVLPVAALVESDRGPLPASRAPPLRPVG